MDRNLQELKGLTMIGRTLLLLGCLLAACGGSQDDSGAMMDDGSGTVADSVQMGEPMETEMLEEAEMGQDALPMSGTSDGGMTADTTR
jgi:hypothetical protein